MKCFNMGEYGCTSRKPTQLLSNASWVLQLPRGPYSAASLPPSKTTHRYIDTKGQKRCTGTRYLKLTQSLTQRAI